MPLIPDDFQQQTEVHEGPSAGLGESATPAQFGQPAAAALDVGGEIATKLHYDAAYAANKVAVNNAMNQIDAAGQKALRDPQTGLLYQQTGAQAPAAAQKTLSNLQEQVGRVRAGLNNDQQREDFDASSRHITDQWAVHSDAYVGVQLEDHTKNVALQTMALSDKAVGDNPDEAQTRIAAMKGSIETTAAALHYTPGTQDYDLFVQQHLQEAKTQLTQTAVQAYIAQNRPAEAQRYLKQYGDDVPLSVRDKLSEQADAANTEQQGQAIAMDFLGKDKLDGGLFDRSKFNEQAENDPRLAGDEKLREAVVRHGEALISQHKDAWSEQNDRTVDKVYGSINDPTNAGAIPPDMRALMKTLPADQQKALETESARMIKANTEHEPPTTDPTVWAQNHDTLLNNPQTLTKHSTAELFTAYGQYYSPSEFKDFVKSVDESRKGVADGTLPGQNQQQKAVQTSIDSVLSKLPDGKNLDDPQQAAFNKTVMQNVMSKVGKLDKDPDDKTLKTMIDSEIGQQTKEVGVDYSGGLFGGSRTVSLPLWQVPLAQRTNVTMPMAQIPNNAQTLMRTQIAKAQNIEGSKVDPKTVQHAYAALVRGDRDAYNAIIQGRTLGDKLTAAPADPASPAPATDPAPKPPAYPAMIKRQNFPYTPSFRGKAK